MDESWRMSMGMPSLPRRRSMETTTPTRRSMEALDPDDFTDVFGGPPRSVLSRKISGDFTACRAADSFYEEVFRPQKVVTRSNSNSNSGRSLPAFRIPARGEGFYCDVFGSDDGGRRSRDRSRTNSKCKSKSNSSSVLSSEDLSPLRRNDDVALSSFTSKLRPLNVPCRWNSNTMKPDEPQLRQQTGNQSNENEWNGNFNSSYFRFSRQVSSPETISVEPNSFRSVKFSVDDLGLNSPSSPVSSLCQEPPETKAGMRFDTEQEDEDEDEAMSSYVIEINSDHREGSREATDVDEAIAWAKESYQSQSCEERSNSQGSTQRSPKEEVKKWKAEEETEQTEEDVEMEMMDEDIKLWSSGKETNIRVLLSTLHHILWPNSGWQAIPLMSLIESCHVKKAYQKARLCLHPDKLQQRGASEPQKYVAEKAFSILQNAWAAFISQDVLFN